jgi:hypothetical protein
VRLVYLDEAGISNPQHEPILVVAGVVVDGDKQWRVVEAHLDELIKKHVPEENRGGFLFYAFELLLFSGVKRFNKDQWPLERRLEILDALVDVPRRFDLPVCAGMTNRKAALDSIGAKSEDRFMEQVMHTNAFFSCCMQVDILMRATTEDEVAVLIAENRDSVRRMLKFVHTVVRGRPVPPGFEAMLELLAKPPYDKIRPLQRVIDTVHFAEKKIQACFSWQMCAPSRSSAE